MNGQMVGWAEVDPIFGSAMPNGSCNAAIRQDDGRVKVCGYPRRPDGTCTGGHPAQPPKARPHPLEHFEQHPRRYAR